MKTILEIKNEAADKAGYKNWDFFLYTFAGANLAIVINLNNEITKLYAEEVIKEAAAVCREHRDSDCFDEEGAEANILNMIKNLK